jgi:hypothetical protein
MPVAFMFLLPKAYFVYWLLPSSPEIRILFLASFLLRMSQKWSLLPVTIKLFNFMVRRRRDGLLSLAVHKAYGVTRTGVSKVYLLILCMSVRDVSSLWSFWFLFVTHTNVQVHKLSVYKRVARRSRYKDRTDPRSWFCEHILACIVPGPLAIRSTRYSTRK